MPSMFGLITFLQTAPPAPTKGNAWGMWYVLVVVASGAIVVFWVIKRIADIAAKRKTDAMIREVGEPTERADFKPEDDAK